MRLDEHCCQEIASRKFEERCPQGLKPVDLCRYFATDKSVPLSETAFSAAYETGLLSKILGPPLQIYRHHPTQAELGWGTRHPPGNKGVLSDSYELSAMSRTSFSPGQVKERGGFAG